MRVDGEGENPRSELAAKNARSGASKPNWLNEAVAALDRRLDRRSSRPLAVAFSGGGDSLGLLLIAKAWTDRVGRRLLALTVDHGLSPQSPRWTAHAGAVADASGVDWRAVAWAGEKPTTGVPAASRAARHALLALAAREAGASVVLLGHTADDRLESELIRVETPGHGWLREWSPSPVWPEGRGLFLLRPLLGVARADLRAYLTGLGRNWFEDPGNADPRFARTRARIALGDAPASGWACSHAEKERGEAVHDLASLARRFVATSDGRLLAPRGELAAATPLVVRGSVAAAVVCAAGGRRPPRGDPLRRLIERLPGEDAFTVGLSGARVVADATTITFAREAGERARGGLEALSLEPGFLAVFDGRFEVEPQAPRLTVGAVAGRARGLCRPDAQCLRSLPADARLALPAIISAEGEASLPAPFGLGPAVARSLVGARFAAAAGLLTCEADLAR